MIISMDIDKIPFFKGIPKDYISNILESFNFIEKASSESIIKFGDPVNNIFIVVQGSVDVFTADDEELLATLKFGDIVGEASLFHGEKLATANVKAGPSGVTFLDMPKKIIEEKILCDDRFAAIFYKGICIVMADRLKSTNQVVSNKIAELKNKLRNLLSDNSLLNKIKNTQENVENLGSEIFRSLASISQLLGEHLPSVHQEHLEAFTSAKMAIEKVLLEDLQDIDRIAQKLGMAIQYLENIERTINNQEIINIRGDQRLFDLE